jgi:hypothetical protein
MQVNAKITTLFIMIISVAWFAFCSPAISQTEAECMQTFAVKPEKNVTYIATDANGSFKPSVTSMSCTDAELFREKLFVSMDRNIYDSEASLVAKLASSQQAIQQIQQQVNGAADASAVKARVAGATAIITTPWAIATTVTCASAVVDGAGLAACGAAARAAISATAAWVAFSSASGDVASVKQKANAEIAKVQQTINSTQQQLDASRAANAKNNYSQLFVGICRAVKQQCL